MPWELNVLDVRDDGIASWTAYLDVETLFPAFGMPMRLSRSHAEAGSTALPR